MWGINVKIPTNVKTPTDINTPTDIKTPTDVKTFNKADIITIFGLSNFPVNVYVITCD